LLYTGTNWDGPRHRGLFEQLDAEPYLDIYGPTNAWCYLKGSYRGSLPFDGISMLDALHSAGVGLCLHRKEHCEAATPSSRIFEIAASGAIAICQEHPFIRANFGDSVLYLDLARDAEGVVAQVSEYMRWIAQNEKEALDLSKRAYEIFSKTFTLEKLLSDLVPHHEKLLAQKQFRHLPSGILGNETVQFIVRVGERKAEYVERTLASLATQTYGPVGAIIVKYREVPGLSELLRKYDHQLGINVVSSSMGLRSTHLWAGLRAVSSQYFGILDDDDVIHPNHVASLLQLLKTSEDCGVAYSGSIRIWESQDTKIESESFGKLSSEPAELAFFEPFDLSRLVALKNFITSNAFIARSTFLKDLGDDPYLPVSEDLFLLLYLCRKTNFVFSYEPTCEFYWRHDRKDNSVLQDQRDWVTASERIKNILWKQSFHSTQSLAHNLPQLEQKLSKLEGKLAQVETALAQTNARLNRYLDFPVIDAVRRFRRMLFRLPPP
jgi:hypothetical protein